MLYLRNLTRIVKVLAVDGSYVTARLADGRVRDYHISELRTTDSAVVSEEIQKLMAHNPNQEDTTP